MMTTNGNLSIETTRKKALEIMQKGMIAYKLATRGWDISEHYGDGYDLIGMKTINSTQIISKIELKAIDFNSYQSSATGFSQAISPNEIFAAEYLIISIFKGIEPEGHFIASVKQVFESVKNKGTKKYEGYEKFSDFREAAGAVAQKKAQQKKGNTGEIPRLSLDIGCTFKKFNRNEWELKDFKDCWDDLEAARMVCHLGSEY